MPGHAKLPSIVLPGECTCPRGGGRTPGTVGGDGGARQELPEGGAEGPGGREVRRAAVASRVRAARHETAVTTSPPAWPFTASLLFPLPPTKNQSRPAQPWRVSTQADPVIPAAAVDEDVG